MSAHNLCFDKNKKKRSHFFHLKFFIFAAIKSVIILNEGVFIMDLDLCCSHISQRPLFSWNSSLILHQLSFSNVIVDYK